MLLSVYDDEQYLYQALRAGAAGYLLKRITAARSWCATWSWSPPGRPSIDATMAGRAAASAARLQRDEFWPGAHLGLTQRESEVLALMVAGLSNRAIAAPARHRRRDGQEPRAVASTASCEVPDRTGAVAAALREGVFR